MLFDHLVSARAETIFPARFFEPNPDSGVTLDPKKHYLVGVQADGEVFYFDPEACKWESVR